MSQISHQVIDVIVQMLHPIVIRRVNFSLNDFRSLFINKIFNLFFDFLLFGLLFGFHMKILLKLLLKFLNEVRVLNIFGLGLNFKHRNWTFLEKGDIVCDDFLD
jgi:hypothetical protein